MKRQTILFTILFTSLLLGAAFSFGSLTRQLAPAAHAQDEARQDQDEARRRCDSPLQHRDLRLRDIVGKYAYQASGSYGPNNVGIPPGTLFTSTALLTFKADGSYETTGWHSIGGATTSIDSRGRLTAVNANGTGQALDSGGDYRYYFVVADGGNIIKVLGITNGLLITGIAHRL